MIDEIDTKIVNILQENARTQNADLARMLKMAPSGVFGRVRKLERDGVIRGYEARVDPDSVGMGLIAFLFIRTAEAVGETGVARKIAQIPEVQEVHVIAGEDCYLVKVRAANTGELMNILRRRLGAFKSIQSIRTTIALHTFKETLQMPLPDTKVGRRK